MFDSDSAKAIFVSSTTLTAGFDKVYLHPWFNESVAAHEPIPTPNPRDLLETSDFVLIAPSLSFLPLERFLGYFAGTVRLMKLHVIGLDSIIIIADLVEIYGWQAECITAMVPAQSLQTWARVALLSAVSLILDAVNLSFAVTSSLTLSLYSDNIRPS